MLKPREAVQNLPSYHPPLAGRKGMRLDFNENTVGCSPRVLERLRSIDPEELARYPERGPVEAKVADFFGVPQNEVLLTNGVDEAIHLMCETYLDPGDEALIVVPTYSMYRIYALAAGAKIVSVPLGERFSFPLTSVIASITRKHALRCRGQSEQSNGNGRIERRSAAPSQTRAPQAAILIDEAYFEFYGETMMSELRAPNLFVARTFSKVYGMAGLRLGILVAIPGR